MSDDHKDYDGIRYRKETGSPAVFRMLFILLLIWGVCFMGYYLFSGWSSDAEFNEKKKAKQTKVLAALENSENSSDHSGKGQEKDDIATGKKTYEERCSACHGEGGKGGIGPALNLPKYKFGKTTGDIKESIETGRPGGMPGFKKDLSHEKIEGLIKYLLSLK